MAIVCDYSQTHDEMSSGLTTEGMDFEIEGVAVRIVVSDDEIAQLLSDYDPTDPTSPDVTTSREIARVVLDALKRHSEE